MPDVSDTSSPDPLDPRAAAQRSNRIFAGTSGWAYPTWKPDFYPEKLPAKKFLPYYATQLNSVEVNYTFRTLPSAKTLENWLASTPPDFRFSFKAPQRITHFKRLSQCDQDVAQFINVLEPVRQAGKLGLLLFQLPPNFKAEADRLRLFLAAAPLAAPHAPPIAFEFRHESWFTAEIEGVLRDHNAALCIAESDDLASPEMHPSSTHTSFRLRRSGGYTAQEIAALAERFVALSAERDVYVYFKHEEDPGGALNAVALLQDAFAQARS